MIFRNIFFYDNHFHKRSYSTLANNLKLFAHLRGYFLKRKLRKRNLKKISFNAQRKLYAIALLKSAIFRPFLLFFGLFSVAPPGRG